MPRLNGWRRLWIVSCVGWFAFVAVGVLWSFPFPTEKGRNSYYFDAEVYAAMQPDHVRRVGRELYLGEKARVEKVVEVDGQFYAFPSSPGVNREPTEDEYRSAIRRMTNGDVFTFPPGTPAAEIGEATADFSAALQRVVRRKQAYYAAIVSLAWLLPCVVSYGVGATVAWVARGFRR